MKRRTFITAAAVVPLAIPGAAEPDSEIMRLYREWKNNQAHMLAVCKQCNADLKASGLTGDAMLDLDAMHDRERITPLNDKRRELETRIAACKATNACEFAAKVRALVCPVFGLTAEWSETLCSDALFIMGEVT